MMRWYSQKKFFKRLVPPAIYRPILAVLRRVPVPQPPTQPVAWGDMRRLTAIGRNYGFSRGLPIDRHYIEAFLRQHQRDIRGKVLEVGSPTYTRQFGGSQVTHTDVLHVEAGNRDATLVGDLATGANIPRGHYDCLILTQVLFCIYDVRGAVSHAYQALRPGGIMLATLPSISQISRTDMDQWGDYWRFTSLSARRLFEEGCPGARVEVAAKGNLLTAAAFLYYLAAEDLTARELGTHDPDYEFLITVRVVRPS